MKPDDEVRELRREQKVWSDQRHKYLSDIIRLRADVAGLQHKLEQAEARERNLSVELALFRPPVSSLVN